MVWVRPQLESGRVGRTRTLNGDCFPLLALRVSLVGKSIVCVAVPTVNRVCVAGLTLCFVPWGCSATGRVVGRNEEQRRRR